jgi:hypothetical protein
MTRPAYDSAGPDRARCAARFHSLAGGSRASIRFDWLARAPARLDVTP